VEGPSLVSGALVTLADTLDPSSLLELGPTPFMPPSLLESAPVESSPSLAGVHDVHVGVHTRTTTQAVQREVICWTVQVRATKG
jgi:hypothetical protein